MTKENRRELEIQLKNLQYYIFEDKDLFQVWLHIKEAREALQELMK